MNSINWTLSDEQTLAEYVPLEDFKGILQQRIGISPDHAALLMRDGRLVEAFNGAHFAVGGLWQKFKSFIGGEHAVRLLVADLKPFPVEGEIEGISRDQVPVYATVSVEFQLNPEKPQNILGLMHENEALIKTDVYQRLLPHLQDRVFASVLNQVDAEEIRGNTKLQDKIQADIMLEAERLFGDLGLMVRAASLVWGLNDEERAAMEERKQHRKQDMLDQEFARRKRELERENEAKEFVLRSDLAAETLKANSEDELKHLFLKQELTFIDARDQGVRQQQMNKLSHEIEVLNTERHAAYAKALEDTSNAIEQAHLRKQLTTVELDIKEMQTLQSLKLKRLQEEQNLDIAERVRRQQIDALRAVNDVESDSDAKQLDNEARRRGMDRDDRQVDHQMEMDRARLEADKELAMLKAQSDMSTEQILAINAGLSPEVAQIFSERARNEGLGAEQQQALLREMLELSKTNHASSEDQARFFYEKGLQGVVSASQGSTSQSSSMSTESQDTDNTEAIAEVECPACHRTNVPITDRFCRFCGHQMRT